MSVLAVIPARLGATRLPQKPLRLLGGVPLIVRVHQRVTSLQVAVAAVVATDSRDILTVCAEYGITAVLTHTDHPSGTDRVAEVAGMAEFSAFSVLLNVQGDEPFVSRDAMLGAVGMVTTEGFPLGTAAAPAPRELLQSSDVVKVVCADDGRALYFSRAAIPFLRDTADAEEQATLARQHVGVYAYTREALAQWVSWAPHPLERVERLEQLRPLAHGVSMGVALVEPALFGGIDTAADLEAAEQYLVKHPDFFADATASSTLHSPTLS